MSRHSLRVFAFVAAVGACGQDSGDGRGAPPLEIKPKGSKRDVQPTAPPTVSLLIRGDALYLGVANAAIPPTTIVRNPGASFDWTALERALTDLRRDPALSDRTDIEVAADGAHPATSYRDLTQAMDIAVKVGFRDVGLVEPASLSWRPTP